MGQSTMAATQEIRVSTAQPGQFPMNCCYSAPALRRAWVSRYSRQLRRRELRNSLKCLLKRLAFTCRNTNFSKSCNKLCQVKIVCLVLVWIRLKPPLARVERSGKGHTAVGNRNLKSKIAATR
jgi:hypothetical protein